MDIANSSRVTSDAPSELAGPLPRTVTLNDSDGRYLLVGVLLFFVGGSIWLGWKGYDDIRQFKHRALLRSDGHVVVGEVTGFSSSRSGPTKVHYAFAFGGVTHTGEAAEAVTWGQGLSLQKADRSLSGFSHPILLSIIQMPGSGLWLWGGLLSPSRCFTGSSAPCHCSIYAGAEHCLAKET
jgi:hypothetical protein